MACLHFVADIDIDSLKVTGDFGVKIDFLVRAQFGIADQFPREILAADFDNGGRQGSLRGNCWLSVSNSSSPDRDERRNRNQADSHSPVDFREQAPASGGRKRIGRSRAICKAPSACWRSGIFLSFHINVHWFLPRLKKQGGVQPGKRFRGQEY